MSQAFQHQLYRLTDMLSIRFHLHILLVSILVGGVNRLQEPYIFANKSVFFIFVFLHKLICGW
jgi:hypothetical protein